jgi:hypothetical protein
MVKSISIPKTPKSAYDPKRKVSNLLKAHIANLEAVTASKTRTTPVRRPRTEAQASAYIAELTERLHPEGLTARLADARYTTLPLAPAPPTPAAKPRRRKKPARASKTGGNRRKRPR